MPLLLADRRAHFQKSSRKLVWQIYSYYIYIAYWKKESLFEIDLNLVTTKPITIFFNDISFGHSVPRIDNVTIIAKAVDVIKWYISSYIFHRYEVNSDDKNRSGGGGSIANATPIGRDQTVSRNVSYIL